MTSQTPATSLPTRAIPLLALGSMARMRLSMQEFTRQCAIVMMPFHLDDLLDALRRALMNASSSPSASHCSVTSMSRVAFAVRYLCTDGAVRSGAGHGRGGQDGRGPRGADTRRWRI